MNKKDIIIIGGGPGGYVAAISAAKQGLNVLLVEKERLGGTCLNFGCIPTKTYYHDAQTLRELSDLKNEGVIEISVPVYNMQKGYERKQGIVDKLVAGVKQLMKDNGISVVYGEALVKEAGIVEVNGEIYRTDHIIIATGSVDSIPFIDGVENENVLTAKGMLDLTEVPKELVIVGGGVIGIEFGCIFNELGSKVTIIEFAPNILGNIDSDITKRMRVFLKKQGIDVNTGAAAKSVNEGENGKLTVTFTDKKGEHTVGADKVLIAAGRKAYFGGIDTEKLGLELEQGFIKVDSDYKTNVDGIYAIGDVIGGWMLAHVASYEGETVVDRIRKKDSSLNMNAVPACVFSFPEIASVGLTESEAVSRGIEVKVGRANYAANGKAMTICETDGFVKIVADMSGKIIGVHIMGAHADDLILEGTVLVDREIHVDEVRQCIHPHPTLGEVLSEAVADVDKKAVHIIYKK